MKHFVLLLYLLFLLVSSPVFSALNPSIQFGIRAGSLLERQPDNSFVNVGRVSIYVRPDLTSMVVIGTYENEADGFFEENLPIEFNSNVFLETIDGNFNLTDLNGITGDSLSDGQFNRLILTIPPNITADYTTSNGDQGIFNNVFQAPNPYTLPGNFYQGPEAGFFEGTYSGSCNTGSRSGEIKLIHEGQGDNVQHYFNHIHFMTIENTNIKEGFRTGVMIDTNSITFNDTTPSGSIFSGEIDFTTNTGSGTWSNPTNNCSGTWNISRVLDNSVQRQNVASAVLPLSRSFQVSDSATVFVALANPYPSTPLRECRISSDFDNLNGTTFDFYAIDDMNNIVGDANQRLDIPANGIQGYLLVFTSSIDNPEAAFEISSSCVNADAPPIIYGLNRVFLATDDDPVPDMVAVTTVVDLPLTVNDTGLFAVGSINVGVEDEITVTATANFGGPTGIPLPLLLSVCQIDNTGACLNNFSSSVTLRVANGETPAFGIAATPTDLIVTDPANNRILINFVGSDGVLRGQTSTAVRAQ